MLKSITSLCKLRLVFPSKKSCPKISPDLGRSVASPLGEGRNCYFALSTTGGGSFWTLIDGKFWHNTLQKIQICRGASDGLPEEETEGWHQFFSRKIYHTIFKMYTLSWWKISLPYLVYPYPLFIFPVIFKRLSALWSNKTWILKKYGSSPWVTFAEIFLNSGLCLYEST